ncbi:MAG TPA: hypothetical protein VMJ92_02875 [Candidatus Limnocylindrales bacterium]|nr:hypothetical protein [Candidatus Limnocylindrales bacterium]
MVDPGPRGRTHWGAVAFTLAAALALVFFVGPWIASLAPGGSSGNGGPTTLPATPSPSAATSAEVPSAEDLHSTWLWQSLPAEIVVGGTVQVSLMYRNTGSVAWVRGTPAEVRLGIVGDDASFHDLGMGPDWPLPARPAIQSESVVEPGQVATFTFDVVGTQAGSYRIPLMPVVDGVAWLGEDEVFAEITVRQ